MKLRRDELRNNPDDIHVMDQLNRDVDKFIRDTHSFHKAHEHFIGQSDSIISQMEVVTNDDETGQKLLRGTLHLLDKLMDDYPTVSELKSLDLSEGD